MPTAPALLSRASAQARADLSAYLAVLTAHAGPGALIELRHRLSATRLAQRFYPTHRPGGLVEAITRLGARNDLYIGVAPRTRRHGGRDAISELWTLWVDCDIPDAVHALADFSPKPTMVVQSGPTGRHAYWALTRPATLDQGEHANRRLAAALAGDPACCDAARVLRPPGTHNFKHQPAAKVILEHHLPRRTYALVDFIGLPDPPTDTPAPARDRPRRDPGADPLLALPPAVYFRALLGRGPGRDGKVACPFHDDELPSLHVYPEPSQGWHCFSCRRGGTVYDLAAHLWFYRTTGREFLSLRARLRAELLGERDQRTRVADSLIRCTELPAAHRAGWPATER